MIHAHYGPRAVFEPSLDSPEELVCVSTTTPSSFSDPILDSDSLFSTPQTVKNFARKHRVSAGEISQLIFKQCRSCIFEWCRCNHKKCPRYFQLWYMVKGSCSYTFKDPDASGPNFGGTDARDGPNRMLADGKDNTRDECSTGTSARLAVSTVLFAYPSLWFFQS